MNMSTKAQGMMNERQTECKRERESMNIIVPKHKATLN